MRVLPTALRVHEDSAPTDTAEVRRPLHVVRADSVGQGHATTSSVYTYLPLRLEEDQRMPIIEARSFGHLRVLLDPHDNVLDRAVPEGQLSEVLRRVLVAVAVGLEPAALVGGVLDSRNSERASNSG